MFGGLQNRIAELFVRYFRGHLVGSDEYHIEGGKTCVRSSVLFLAQRVRAFDVGSDDVRACSSAELRIYLEGQHETNRLPR